MSRFKIDAKLLLTTCVLALFFGSLVPAAHAQAPRRTRRESNVNRRARIQREVEETYSHRFEIAGGGGYLRFRSGQFLQKNNEVTFWTSGTYLLNPKLGIIADLHGAYGYAKINNGNVVVDPGFDIPNPQISQYTFTGGPSYRFYARQKTAASVFATGGVALGKFQGGSKGIPAADLGIWNSDFAPVFTAGVNFDYNFYPNLAVRVTPTYIGTLFQSTVQNNLGLNVGVVYRFGRIH